MITAILMTAAMLMVVLKILHFQLKKRSFVLVDTKMDMTSMIPETPNVHHPIAACIRSNEQTTNLLTTPIVMPVQVDLQPSRKVRTLELQIIH